MHEDTVGFYIYNGKTYEIDWPCDLEDETKRNTLFGAIYLGDRQVGECMPEYISEGFTSPGQVIKSAVQVIESGHTDDQRK